MIKYITLFCVILVIFSGCYQPPYAPLMSKLYDRGWNEWDDLTDLVALDDRSIIFSYDRLNMHSLMRYNIKSCEVNKICSKEKAIIYDPEVSPCGKFLALAISYSDSAASSEIAIYDIENKEWNSVGPKDAICSSPSFSPNSSKLAFSCSFDKHFFSIYEYDIPGQSLEKITDGEVCDAEPLYLDDNSILFWRAQWFGGSGMHSYRWHDWQLFRDNRRGRPKSLSKDSYSKPVSVLAPDKSYVLFSDDDYKRPLYYVRYLDRKKEIYPLTFAIEQKGISNIAEENYCFHAPSISPCSRYICIACGKEDLRIHSWSADIYLVDTLDFSAIQLTDISAYIQETCFSHDGKDIFFVTKKRPQNLWKVSLGTLEKTKINIADLKGISESQAELQEKTTH